MPRTAAGKVVAIFIAPAGKAPMQEVQQVKAVEGHGLEGDRYCEGVGSFSKKSGPGARQVTLINKRFFREGGFRPQDTRRNVLTEGIELMLLIGQEFEIGGARFRGVKYLTPCGSPKSSSDQPTLPFHREFFDAGGLIAEVVRGGEIKPGDAITSNVTVYYD